MSKWLFVLAFMSSLANSKTCLVLYDKEGYNNEDLPMVSQMSTVANDKNCSEIIFYPAIPELGSINEKTGVQKIILDNEKRSEVLEYLRSKNFLSTIQNVQLTLEKVKAFQGLLKKTEKIEKQFVYFHGVSGMILGETIKLNKDPKAAEVYYKKTFTDDDLHILFKDQPFKIEEHKKTLKSDKENNNTVYQNPCYTDAIVADIKETDKVGENIVKEIMEIANKAKEKADCALLPKLEGLLKKYPEAPRDKEYCEKVFAMRLAIDNSNRCMLEKLSFNLIDSSLISATTENSETLVLSCAVAAEENVSKALDEEVLLGCPNELEKYRQITAEKYKGNSKQTANKMCKNAPNGSSFAIATNISIPAPPPPLLKAEEDNTHEDSNQEKIVDALMSLISACDPKRLNNFTQYVNLLRTQENVIDDTSHSSHHKLAVVEKKINEISCNDEGLNENEIKSLKSDLSETHLALLVRAHYYDAFTNSNLHQMEALDRVLFFDKNAASFVKLNDEVTSNYENLNLETKDSQLKALNRYAYMLREIDKLSGFFDCYKCNDGIANLTKCDKLNNSFQDVSNIGNRKKYNKIHSLGEMGKKLLKAAKGAEKLTPPLCRAPIPPCDFKNSNCLDPKNKQKHL